MSGSRCGHGMVEFALAFPFFVLLSLGMMEFIHLGLRQFRLERAAVRVARELSLTSITSTEEMRAQAGRFLSFLRPPVEISIRVRPLPQHDPLSPLRQRKTAEILEIVLVQRLSFRFSFSRLLELPLSFTLRSRVHEARFRPEPS